MPSAPNTAPSNPRPGPPRASCLAQGPKLRPRLGTGRRAGRLTRALARRKVRLGALRLKLKGAARGRERELGPGLAVLGLAQLRLAALQLVPRKAELGFQVGEAGTRLV